MSNWSVHSTNNLTGGWSDAAIDSNDNIYHSNGVELEKWNGSSWSTIATVPTERRRQFKLTSDSSDNIYIIAGDDSNYNTINTVEMWDGNSWTSVPNMNTAVTQHGAVGDNNGNIYVAGGLDSNFNRLGTVEKFDGSSWTFISDMPSTRSRHGCAMRNGNLIVAGGRDDNGYNIDDMYSWDGNSWSVLDFSDGLLDAREYAGVTGSNGYIYYVGGNGEDIAQKVGSGDRGVIAQIPTYREKFGLIADSNNEVYAIGGTDANFNTFTTVEKYTPPSTAPSAPSNLSGNTV